MVKLLNKWLTAVSVVTLGASTAAGQELQELTAAQCERPTSFTIEVECACQEALELGTIEAIENFINEYGDEDSACTALAFNALAQFTPDENSPLTSGDRDEIILGGYGG